MGTSSALRSRADPASASGDPDLPAMVGASKGKKMSGFRPCSVQKRKRFTYFAAEHGGIVLHPEGVD